MKKIIFITALCALLLPALSASAARLNDRLENRPYADLRRWHLGFGVSTLVQDISFSHSGFLTEGGEEWYMEQPSFSPGFGVNGLIDLRLHTHVNLRFAPGLLFGNRQIEMVNHGVPATDAASSIGLRQNLKSTFIVLPFDVKLSSLRYRNSRPYLSLGVMPAFDVTRRRNDYLRLRPTDCYLSVALGCDFYLPFFKLIPELKFCFGLTDVIEHDRPDLTDDHEKFKITQSLRRATSSMVILTFYFE